MDRVSFKTRIFSIYIISIILISLLITELYIAINSSNVGKVSIDNFKQKTSERQEFLHSFFYPYFSSIKAIKENRIFVDYLSDKLDQDIIEEYFLSIKKSLPCLSGIRFIDLNGDEKIKVNGVPFFHGENAVSKIIPSHQHQNQSHKSYIKKFLNLDENKIGVSQITLNTDHGKVSSLKQVVLRIAMTVYDQDKNKKGILVLSICLKEFFELLDKTTLYNVYLIDDKGVFLNHNNPKYGFLGEQNEYSIFDHFKIEDKELFQKDEYFGDTFYVKKIDYFNNGQNLRLVLELKFNEELDGILSMQKNFLISAVLFALILIPVLYYFSKIPDLLRKQLKAKEEIENKNLFISTLFENIPIPIYFKGLDRKYIDVNSSLLETYGLEKERFIGKTSYDITEKDIADIYTRHDDKLLKDDEDTQVYQSILKSHKTNKIHKVVFHKSILFDNKNKPLGIIGAIIDISELKEVENKLKELNDNLEQEVIEQVNKNLKKEMQLFESAKLAAMGSMIGNIIHQWKQPLNYISLLSSSLRLKASMETIDTDFINNTSKSIEETIFRLSDITNTFRDFLKEKKLVSNVILQERIDKALIITNTILSHKGVKLIKSIDSSKPVNIVTIANELMEVIINIVNNAIDVLEERDIKDPWVEIKLIEKKDYVLISIEDNAGGIPKNVMPYIFDEYFTTKDDDKGTGLGLYMSCKIVYKSLKGKLEVENTNNGAKFTLKLPYSIA